MEVLILLLGEHQKILTISFTGIFSFELNAVQFTFEIRCKGKYNVTRHIAVLGPFVQMFLIYDYIAIEENCGIIKKHTLKCF